MTAMLRVAGNWTDCLSRSRNESMEDKMCYKHSLIELHIIFYAAYIKPLYYAQ